MVETGISRHYPNNDGVMPNSHALEEIQSTNKVVYDKSHEKGFFGKENIQFKNNSIDILDLAGYETAKWPRFERSFA